MSQTKQLQKVKLFRALKIAFYTLGLPLFFFAVVCTAFKFIGEDPFVGMASSSLNSGVFQGYERFINSPALYGIWCALAVWVFIVICHVVVSKTMKNTRARLFTMIAVVLIVMLGTMGIMDAAFTSQMDKIATDAPAGVTVEDYKSQLSYYDYVSYDRMKKSLTYDLINTVDRLKDAYNIDYQGLNKSGDAGNIGNKPVTFGRLLDENGNHYTGSESAEKLVTVKPNSKGQLEIDGKVYGDYYYMSRKGGNGTEVTVWYDLSLVPLGKEWKAKSGKMQFNTTDGIYGEGLYNESGLLSDGWIFSLENVLEILEDLYEGQANLNGADASVVSKIQSDAFDLRQQYYNGEKEVASKGGKVSDRLKAIYNNEIEYSADFYLSQKDIEDLYSCIGELLGNNSLFEWLLAGNGEATFDSLGSKVPMLKGLVGKLKEGASLTDLLGSFGLGNYVSTALTFINPMFEREDIQDVILKLNYKNGEHDNLFIEAFGKLADGTTVLLFDIDCTADQSKFNLENLSTFLNEKLTALVSKLGLAPLLNTIGGLAFEDMTVGGETYKGLVISGISIPLLNENGEFAIDVESILFNLLQTLYSYQSPVIKPVWEFYEDAATNDAERAVARDLAMYERAYYEATVHGALIGSVLYGDTLGTGAYGSGAGLTDLASVRQLKTDLSYQPKSFPLYKFRDMLLTSSGIVVFFYLLYMLAAEQEKRYAKALLGEGNCSEGGDDKGEGKAEDATATEDKQPEPDNAATDKSKRSVSDFFDGLKKRTNWNDGKTARLGKILSIVLYVVAFLPVVLIPLVLGAMSCHLLPSYSIWHFLGFIIAVVFAAIFAAVILLVSRKKANKGALARGWRIGVTYICLTTVFGLLLTYLMPDLVAKGTSSTLFAEDMYYNTVQQVEENATLEHQFIIYNLLNGNLNRYEEKNGKVVLAENGDFSYEGLTVRNAKGTLQNEKVYEFFKQYQKDASGRSYTLKTFAEMVDGLDPLKQELYNFVYQYYVLNDFGYAFDVKDDTTRVGRRRVALAVTEYLYQYAGYEKLVKKGLKDPKVAQLFRDNYDSFNQDGYKTFDDPLLLYAQLDGRMTIPVVLRLILNKGWSYSQPDADGNYAFENNFLYEVYDLDAYNAYKAVGGTFDKEGQLTNGDGSKLTVKYGYNEDGWMIFENGVVKRPVNWLVLDMLGDPMDLASIQLPSRIDLGDIGEIPLGQILDLLSSSGIYEDALGGLLGKDVGSLVEKVANGASLRIGAYIDDDLQLKLQLLPMNSYFGMLGYMQASWVQSNNLIMAIINIESMRNGMYIMGGIGTVLILLAIMLSEMGKKAEARLAEQGESAEKPEGEQAPEQDATPETEEHAE